MGRNEGIFFFLIGNSTTDRCLQVQLIKLERVSPGDVVSDWSVLTENDVMYFMSLETHVFTDILEAELCNAFKIADYQYQSGCYWVQSDKLIAACKIKGRLTSQTVLQVVYIMIYFSFTGAYIFNLCYTCRAFGIVMHRWSTLTFGASLMLLLSLLFRLLPNAVELSQVKLRLTSTGQHVVLLNFITYPLLRPELPSAVNISLFSANGLEAIKRLLKGKIIINFRCSCGFFMFLFRFLFHAFKSLQLDRHITQQRTEDLKYE